MEKKKSKNIILLVERWKKYTVFVLLTNARNKAHTTYIIYIYILHACIRERNIRTGEDYDESRWHIFLRLMYAFFFRIHGKSFKDKTTLYIVILCCSFSFFFMFHPSVTSFWQNTRAHCSFVRSLRYPRRDITTASLVIFIRKFIYDLYTSSRLLGILPVQYCTRVYILVYREVYPRIYNIQTVPRKLICFFFPFLLGENDVFFCFFSSAHRDDIIIL